MQRAWVVHEGETEPDVLHLGGSVFAIPAVERFRAALGVADRRVRHSHVRLAAEFDVAAIYVDAVGGDKPVVEQAQLVHQLRRREAGAFLDSVQLGGKLRKMSMDVATMDVGQLRLGVVLERLDRALDLTGADLSTLEDREDLHERALGALDALARLQRHAERLRGDLLAVALEHPREARIRGDRHLDAVRDVEAAVLTPTLDEVDQLAREPLVLEVLVELGVDGAAGHEPARDAESLAVEDERLADRDAG